MSDQHSCPHCFLEFETHSLKANHIRWKHKLPEGFTTEGRAAHSAAAVRLNRERHGEKLERKVACKKCGAEFIDHTCEKSRRKRKPLFCSMSCANSHVHTDESKKRVSDGMKRRLADDPELLSRCVANLANVKNRRCSSKAERALCECLRPLGFVRHRVMRTPDGSAFDVDAVSHDGRVWVESDGEWHFRQVHAGHDFEKTRARDVSEETEAVRRGVLLVRLNNQKHDIEEQVRLVLRTIEEWDGTSGAVVKHW